MVGVPHVSAMYVVAGGKYVTSVVGAVPVMVVAGLVVAVPPEITSTPGDGLPGSTQTVVRISAVGVEALSTLRSNWMY